MISPVRIRSSRHAAGQRAAWMDTLQPAWVLIWKRAGLAGRRRLPVCFTQARIRAL